MVEHLKRLAQIDHGLQAQMSWSEGCRKEKKTLMLATMV